jgi:RNA polymerase sigma-70 factor, ECF subfamily
MLGALRWPGHGARMVGEEVTTGVVSHASRLGDEALVLAVARGDRLAMAALYDRYAALLLAVATRIVGNRVQAEDLLHDVLLEAWHRAGEYDPERGTVRAWLVTRVRSRALDDRIGCARRAELVRSKLPSFDETAHAACDDSAADGDHVRREVACLPRDLELVIDLAYFEGLSAVEIGVRLKIPAGTVKSRLARAMALLRRHFLGQARGAT